MFVCYGYLSDIGMVIDHRLQGTIEGTYIKIIIRSLCLVFVVAYVDDIALAIYIVEHTSFLSSEVHLTATATQFIIEIKFLL